MGSFGPVGSQARCVAQSVVVDSQSVLAHHVGGRCHSGSFGWPTSTLAPCSNWTRHCCSGRNVTVISTTHKSSSSTIWRRSKHTAPASCTLPTTHCSLVAQSTILRAVLHSKLTTASKLTPNK